MSFQPEEKKILKRLLWDGFKFFLAMAVIVALSGLLVFFISCLVHLPEGKIISTQGLLFGVFIFVFCAIYTHYFDEYVKWYRTELLKAAEKGKEDHHVG